MSEMTLAKGEYVIAGHGIDYSEALDALNRGWS